MTPSIHLLIIGGGIAGLSAAWYATQFLPQARITLLERSQRWGGKIVTERIHLDGGQFIVEGGPDTFLATKPWAVNLCRELGLEKRLHGTNPEQRNTYVLKGGQLYPLPEGLAMMIPSDVPSILRSRLISWPGKLRMGLDFFLPPQNGHEDESLGQFVSRRLGREAYEALIEPLMSGIYAGDGDRLSLQATFPYLRDLEQRYGSLVRGALAMRRKMPHTPGSRSAFLTPTTGLSEIVETLVEHLAESGVDLRLGIDVAQVNRKGGEYLIETRDGDTWRADALILATPAFVSGMLVSHLDPQLSAALLSIPYTSTATVSVAYPETALPRPLDGYGYVIPRREGRRALACTWTSTKFPHRAPAGYALLRVFIGRAGEGELPSSEEVLLEIAREEVRLTLGITAPPLFSRVFRWEKAMPQYNLGHPQAIASIQKRLEDHPGLALAGNAYHGIGLPDCIHSGEMAVQRIIQTFPQRSLP